MATVKEVYQIMDQYAPFATQMGFDNAGFLVGNGEGDVTKILLSLDITLPVIEEAKKLGAQLIVAHHPVIFDPVKRIVAGDPTGDKLISLIKYDIAAICAHTNLDIAVDGVNDALAEKLELKDIQVFESFGTDQQGRAYGLGRVGLTEQESSLTEYAERVKVLLGSNGVRYVDTGRPIRKVAVGGGSCGSSLYEAYKQGCDVFITADVKYDVFLEAKALGINLIDAGHYPTENVVLPKLEALLKNALPGVEICQSTVHKEVFSYL